MMTIQNYVRAGSLEEAWQLNQKRNNRILGGGMWLRLSGGNIHTAIDLCDLHLDQVEETEDAFLIGAMTSLRALEMHEALNAATCGAIRDAVRDIVGVQFRNMATVGGSIWGRYGFSDVLTVLLALDCDVELYKGGVVPLAQFAGMKKDNDILVRLIVRKTPRRAAYASVRNQRTDFPVLALCAAQVGGEIRVSVGARPAKAVLVRDETGLLSGGITQESAKAYAAHVSGQVKTDSNVRGSREYRSRLVRVLTERCLLSLGGEK